MLKYLLEHDMIDGSTLTVTGKTMAENLAACPPLKEGQDVIWPLEKPIKPDGHLQILYGNLAPEGSVGKITGKEGLVFQGAALCFEQEEAMLAALEADPASFKVRAAGRPGWVGGEGERRGRVGHAVSHLRVWGPCVWLSTAVQKPTNSSSLPLTTPTPNNDNNRER